VARSLPLGVGRGGRRSRRSVNSGFVSRCGIISPVRRCGSLGRNRFGCFMVCVWPNSSAGAKRLRSFDIETATQRADRIRPADPFRDHRRRHPRKPSQQPTNPRLIAIHQRPRPHPLILRWPIVANAAFTVFREQPISRAISEIDTSSDLRSRRISAQSSTISTRFLPGSTRARVTGQLVNFPPCRTVVSIQLPPTLRASLSAVVRTGVRGPRIALALAALVARSST